MGEIEEDDTAPISSFDRKRSPDAEIKALRQKKERLRKELRQIEREIKSLSAAPRKRKRREEDSAHRNASTERSSAVPRLSDVGRAKSLADRSRWSPELRKLIEEMFPEEGKEERIRQANQKSRSFILGEGLAPEVVRYYAEDVDLEYDF